MPSQPIDLEHLEQRVYRDSLQDGIMEILAGLLLIMWGLAITDPAAGTILLCFCGMMLFLFRRSSEKLKRRLTYPRLGEVVLRDEKPAPLVAGILLYILATGVLVAVALALFGRLTTAEWYRWLPVWIGLCLIGACWHLYSKSGRVRYLIFALVALGGGFAAGSPRLPARMDNIALHLFCLGALSALAGAVMLIRFLRSHPVHAGNQSNA
jgi:cbb3-type cytochrome oxidase subunit 3